MDYATLIASKSVDGSIKNFVNDDKVPATTILQEAQAWIDLRLRCRQQFGTFTGTMTASQAILPLPADYVDMRTLNITGVNKGRIGRARPEEIEERYDYDDTGARVPDKPSRFYANGVNAVLDAIADQSYPYRGLYYARSPILGTATTTNFLTDRYPTLLRAVCMAMANGHRKDDEEKAYWEAKALAEVAEINKRDDAEQWRDAEMRMEAV